MLLTCGGLVIKMMTQGPLAFLKQPWYMLDVACLLLALMTLMTSLMTPLIAWCPRYMLDLICLLLALFNPLNNTDVITFNQRIFGALASLRALMLFSRFNELKHISESIARSLPNVLIALILLVTGWLIFALIGLSASECI